MKLRIENKKKITLYSQIRNLNDPKNVEISEKKIAIKNDDVTLLHGIVSFRLREQWIKRVDLNKVHPHTTKYVIYWSQVNLPRIQNELSTRQ